MIDGPVVVLRGESFVVPPLQLRDLRKYMPQIEAMAKLKMSETLDLLRDVIYAALKQNYPDLTPERLDELLDAKNMNDTLTKVLDASGLVVKKTLGEA